MKCTAVNFGDGRRGFVCGTRSKPKKCSCGKPGTLLCDWKMGDGKTCDAPLCVAHAADVGREDEDKHLCPLHALRWDEMQAAKALNNGE